MPGSAACARRLFQDGKQIGPCCLGAAAWLKPPTKQALSAWVSPARTQHKSSPSSPALEFWKENGRGERDACSGYGFAHHTTPRGPVRPLLRCAVPPRDMTNGAMAVVLYATVPSHPWRLACTAFLNRMQHCSPTAPETANTFRAWWVFFLT